MKKQALQWLAALLISGFSSSVIAASVILTVGDSITSGLKLNGAGTYWECPPDGRITSSFIVCNGNGVRDRGGFQPDIQSLMAQRNQTVTLYNWGFAGEESWTLVNRVSQAMNSRASDTVTIMAGINDLNDNVSIQTTSFNVRTMMDRVQQEGRRAVVGTITPHSGSSSYNPKIAQINALIKADAAARGVRVADHYSVLIQNWPGLSSGDGVHLSNTADALVAEQWVNALGGGAAAVGAIQLLLLD